MPAVSSAPSPGRTPGPVPANGATHGAGSRRFQFEVEILVRAVWSGIPIEEVPVPARYGSERERISHFRPFVDFMRNFVVFTKLILLRLFGASSIRKEL